ALLGFYFARVSRLLGVEHDAEKKKKTAGKGRTRKPGDDEGRKGKGVLLEKTMQKVATCKPGQVWILSVL
ncbi:hypothetical protein, partial [Enterococcus faecium]